MNNTDIINWLNKYRIENYTITDGVVDIDGNLGLMCKGLKTLPFKFGTVTGNVALFINELETLENAPHTVGGDFDVSHNRLKTLKGFPKSVGGHCMINQNDLQEIDDFALIVGGRIFMDKDLGAKYNLRAEEAGIEFSQVLSIVEKLMLTEKIETAAKSKINKL